MEKTGRMLKNMNLNNSNDGTELTHEDYKKEAEFLRQFIASMENTFAINNEEKNKESPLLATSDFMVSMGANALERLTILSKHLSQFN